MSNSIDDFDAQWRASAHEAVPYTSDFPESFLVLPELIDGAIGQGNATKVTIEIKLIDDKFGYLKVTDNGIGVRNPNRLLSWASKESESMHHRYGHGSKKCLTKWNKDYNSEWYVKYRHKDIRGAIGSLFQYNSPFKGNNTIYVEDEKNETELMPSGLEWYIKFNREILNNKNTVDDIFDSIKEIIRTRYSRKYFDKIDFVLKIFDKDKNLEESSKEKNWTTFQEEIINEIKEKNCVEIYNKDLDFNPNTKVTYQIYYLKIYGGRGFNLKKEFKTYGQKNMNCSRIYISLNQRVIEVAPLWKFMKDRESNHNDYNGVFAFINFENLNENLNETVNNNSNKIYKDNLPTPCTTKVSFYEHCPNLKKMRDLLVVINQEYISKRVLDKYREPQSIKTTPPPSPVKKVVKSKNKPILPSQKLSESKSESESESESESDSASESELYYQSMETLEIDLGVPPPVIIPRKSKSKNISKAHKSLVWAKYIGDTMTHLCLCCKNRQIKVTDFECGHVEAKAKGGKDGIDNLRPICRQCNSSMGSQNMIDFVKQNEYFIGDGIN